jgi:hypothetical protein
MGETTISYPRGSESTNTQHGLLQGDQDSPNAGMSTLSLEHRDNLNEDTDTEARYQTTDVEHGHYFGCSLQNSTDNKEQAPQNKTSASTKRVTEAGCKCTKEGT